MDRKCWKLSCKYSGKHKWYNKTRKLQKSLQYNLDPSANIIHHLRDTEEQRKYNDEHYELWGHNLDGTFEYGKYVIFVTKEEHAEIHKCSEETRQKIIDNHAEMTDDLRLKISNAVKLAMDNDNVRAKISKANKGRKLTEETKEKISTSNKGKHVGENNSMYGKHLSDEHKRKISEAEKGKITSDETKAKQRESKLGEKNPMYGKHLSDDHKLAIHNKLAGRKQSEEAISNQKSAIRKISDQYFEYKAAGGTLGWNEFKHYLKEQKKNAKSKNEQS